jgi:hypothetical protein
MAKEPKLAQSDEIELLKLQVEIWKKVVQTQEHFNDLGLRIRNFGILLLAAFLGIGGYALKEQSYVPVLGLNVSLAGLIVLSAVLPWKAFYLMDKFWYHRLLKGSVNAGIPIEAELKKRGLIAALGEHISKESKLPPIQKWWLLEWSNKPLRSDDRMDAFYALVTRSIVLLSTVLIVFGFFSHPAPKNAAPKTPGTTVVLDNPAPNEDESGNEVLLSTANAVESLPALENKAN